MTVGNMRPARSTSCCPTLGKSTLSKRRVPRTAQQERTAEDFAILRLDKNNYKRILSALTARTGENVETVAGEK